MISTTGSSFMNQKRCVIVGGGISGLISGALLNQAGIQVTVLDKGRCVGGRLATRRIRSSSCIEGIFDYGAQLLTASEPTFKLWMETFKEEGVARDWASQGGQSDNPCYFGVSGNRGIAECLARELNVHTLTRVIKLDWKFDHWLVQAENGSEFHADYLIVTAPIPQSLFLLDSSEILLKREIRQRLENVIYQKCIAVLALLERPSILPDPGAIRVDASSLVWIACNQRKGISQGNAVTLHSSPEFSQMYWEANNSIVAEKLIEAAAPLLGSSVIEYHVHRWRYSHPITTFGESYLDLDRPGQLLMAGDAFSLNRSTELTFNAEQAFLSGCAAANFLLKHN